MGLLHNIETFCSVAFEALRVHLVKGSRTPFNDEYEKTKAAAAFVCLLHIFI